MKSRLEENTEQEIQKVPQRVVAKSSLLQPLCFVSLLCSTPLSTVAWLSPSRTGSRCRQQFQRFENLQETNPFQCHRSSISLNRNRQQLCGRRLSQLQKQNIDRIHHHRQQQYGATTASIPQQLQYWKSRFSRLLLRLRKKCTPRNRLILSLAILFVSLLIIFPSKSIAVSPPPPVIDSVAGTGVVTTPAVLAQQVASQPPPLTTTPAAATATTATTLRTSHQRALSQKMELTLSLRLLFASLAGGAVGWERAASHHSAGVRTMALVSLGAAAFTICSLYGFIGTKFDASRVASNVASGVGFIGAGVITTHKMQHQQHQLSLGNNNTQHLPPPISVVHGLTTAAAIWLSAAVGVASGVGLYFISGTTAISTILILRFGRVKQTKFGERIGYVSKNKGVLHRNKGQMLLLQQDAGVGSFVENKMETYHRNGDDEHHHHDSHEHHFDSLEDTHDLSTWDEELPPPPPVVGDGIAHHFSSESSSWHHVDDDSSDVLSDDHNDKGDNNNNSDDIVDSMLFQEEELDVQRHDEGRVAPHIEIMEINTTTFRTEELTHYEDMGEGRMDKEDTDLRTESTTQPNNDDDLQS